MKLRTAVLIFFVLIPLVWGTIIQGIAVSGWVSVFDVWWGPVGTRVNPIWLTVYLWTLIWYFLAFGASKDV